MSGLIDGPVARPRRRDELIDLMLGAGRIAGGLSVAVAQARRRGCHVNP